MHLAVRGDQCRWADLKLGVWARDVETHFTLAVFPSPIFSQSVVDSPARLNAVHLLFIAMPILLSHEREFQQI